MNWLQGALFVVYALSVHLFAVTGRGGAAVLALGALAGAVLVPALRARNVLAVLAIVSAGACALLAGIQVIASMVLCALPVGVNAGLAWLFGHTLRKGREPLVARLVRLLHPANDLEDEAVWPYARRVTLLWTSLFCFNGAVCLALGLLAVPGGILHALGVNPGVEVPLAWWSWFANLGCYLLSGGLFAVEYAYRRRRFPWQPYRNFFHFCQRAAHVGPALMADLRAGSPARKL